MPILIFTAHGETISPTDELTAVSCLIAIRKIDAILACLPENLRIPRPLVFCGTDNKSTRTAEIISSCLVAQYGKMPALGENSAGETRAFAAKLLKFKRPCLVISHAEIIDLLIADIAALLGQQITAPRSIGSDGIIAIDTDTRPVRMTETSVVLTVQKT
jgi:hypothetical protein